MTEVVRSKRLPFGAMTARAARRRDLGLVRASSSHASSCDRVECLAIGKERGLAALAQGLDGKGTKWARSAQDRPIAGTRLVREWQGIEHSVTVRDDGYEYQGRPYKSLSAIARLITGTRWNGWVFFGLKNQRARP
jgi:hypothetical protein